MRDEAPTESIAAGQTVAHGRYVLLRELGRGGLATVFLARDARDGSEVALKVLRDRYVGRPEREERLRREFEYAARVEHPAVVRMRELGTLHDGRPFVSMELVPGRPLSRIISGSGGLPFERTKRLARALAEALCAVHRAGIVHRDVKPDNVLVLPGDRIKLLDFGMAGDVDAPALPAGHGGRLTRANDLLGTHEYMAPEQVLKAPPRKAMDVFALGVVMYEMLSSTTPYSGMGAREYVELQLRGDPMERSAARWARIRGAPDGFAELVDACRRREPEARPGIEEVLERLRGVDGLEESSSPVLAVEVVAAERRRARAWWRPAAWVMVPAAVVGLLWVSVGAGTAGDEERSGAEARVAAEVVGEVEDGELAGLAAEPVAVAAPLAEDGLVAVAAADAKNGEGVVERSTDEGRAFLEVEAVDVAEDAGSADGLGIAVADAAVDEPVSTEHPRSRPGGGRASTARAGSSRTSPPKTGRSGPAEPEPAELAANEPDCERVITDARAARAAYRWTEVLTHTRTRTCWADDEAEYLAMRTEALMEAGRWADCVRTGNRSADPEVRRYAQRCQMRLDTIMGSP